MAELSRPEALLKRRTAGLTSDSVQGPDAGLALGTSIRTMKGMVTRFPRTGPPLNCLRNTQPVKTGVLS